MLESQVNLRADCNQCFGLCCTALAFTTSTDFAMTKQVGQACPHLDASFQCNIHENLREKGFRGCTVYDCFGAGQHVSQITYQGIDWRHNPEFTSSMFEVFPIMTQLHELLWYVQEALSYPIAASIHSDLLHFLGILYQWRHKAPAELVHLNITELRNSLSPLLRLTSQWIREEARTLHEGPLPSSRLEHTDPSLWIGANLLGADLRYSDFRGAYFIAANLRHADLRKVDLLGADLRDADLSNANLTGSIFLTQTQINAAKGNHHTLIPSKFLRPTHWN